MLIDFLSLYPNKAFTFRTVGMMEVSFDLQQFPSFGFVFLVIYLLEGGRKGHFPAEFPTF